MFKENVQAIKIYDDIRFLYKSFRWSFAVEEDGDSRSGVAALPRIGFSRT